MAVLAFPSNNLLINSVKVPLAIVVLAMITLLFLLITRGKWALGMLKAVIRKTPFYKIKAADYVLKRLRISVESFSKLGAIMLFRVAVISILRWALQALLLLALFRSVKLGSLGIIQSIIVLVVLGFAVVIP